MTEKPSPRSDLPPLGVIVANMPNNPAELNLPFKIKKRTDPLQSMLSDAKRKREAATAPKPKKKKFSDRLNETILKRRQAEAQKHGSYTLPKNESIIDDPQRPGRSEGTGAVPEAMGTPSDPV